MLSKIQQITSDYSINYILEETFINNENILDG